jgi:hypothetical protein
MVAVGAAGDTLGNGLSVSPAVTFSAPLPLLPQPCVTVTWTNSRSGVDAPTVIDTVGTGYMGLAADLTQGQGCESVEGGTGSISISLWSTLSPLGSTLSCSFSGGGYEHLGPIMTLEAPGSCTINGISTGQVYLNGTALLESSPSLLSTGPYILLNSWQIVP